MAKGEKDVQDYFTLAVAVHYHRIFRHLEVFFDERRYKIGETDRTVAMVYGAISRFSLDICSGSI